MASNQISTSPYLLSDANQAAYHYNGEMPPEQALEEQALNRRQHIMNLLIQQGLGGGNHGQMVGRFYVPGSPLQGLGDLAKVGLGAYGTYANDQAREGLTKDSNAMLADAVANYKHGVSDIPAVPTSGAMPGPQAAVAEAMAAPQMDQMPMGPPASPSIFSGHAPMGPDTSGWEPKGPIQDLNGAAPSAPQQQVAQAMVPQAPMQGPVSPGTPGRARTPEERQQALIDLMASPHPRASHIGQFLAQQEQQLAMKKMHDEFLMGLTGVKAAQAKDLKETVSGDVGITQAGAASRTDLGKIQQIDTILEGMDPASVEAKTLQDLRTKLSTHAPASSQTVNVDQGVPLVKELMVKGADAVSKTHDAAQVAQGSLNTIQQVEDAMKTGKVIVGPGANPQIYLRQIGQIIGVTGKDNDEVLRNTRSAIQGMAKLQLDSSRSAQGQGSISDYERQLFVRASAGENLSGPEILELMGAMRKTSQYTIGLNTQNVKKIRNLPKGGNVVAPFFELPGQGASAPSTVPTTNGKPNAFQPFHDPDEEQAYQQWKLEHK